LDKETSKKERKLCLKILDEFAKEELSNDLQTDFENYIEDDIIFEKERDSFFEHQAGLKIILNNSKVEIIFEKEKEEQFSLNLKPTLTPEEFLKMRAAEKAKKLREKTGKYLKKLVVFNFKRNMATKNGHISLLRSNDNKLEEKRKKEQLISDFKNLSLSETLERIEKEKKKLLSEEKRFRGYRNLNRHDRNLRDKLGETMKLKGMSFKRVKVKKDAEFKFDKKNPTVFLNPSFYYENPFENDMATKTGYIFTLSSSNNKLEEKKKKS